MGHKLAIDFGTTNSVVAHWDEAASAVQVMALPGLSVVSDERPPLVPSLLYIHNAAGMTCTAGQAVRSSNLDQQHDNRLFRNFKRGIVTTPAPPPRGIDGQWVDDRTAGRQFIQTMLNALPYRDADIEQLVLTAPVAAFEGYLSWLNGVIDTVDPEKIRVIDESTAAALGYAVTEPGAVVLVFDFGGGTLDLSLVQLPENARRVGGFLRRILGSSSQNKARVIAKAGRVMGGSDIDQWILAEVLKRTGITPELLGSAYPAMLTACETLKIALSVQESAELALALPGRSIHTTFTRADLEALLTEHGFYDALRRVVDKVMHTAHQRGIFREDIHHVLMVGGTSLMPSVQAALGRYFSNMAVRADKPFTAVAEGAIQLALGNTLEDYLAHSYGLRHLDTTTGAHAWDEMIPAGTVYPLTQPVELVLGAAHPDQQEIELIVGEVDTDAVSLVEVRYENGEAVFVADTRDSERKVVPINAAEALETLAKLTPPGTAGTPRARAFFTVDARRRLRVTMIDTLSGAMLLNDAVLATLQ